MPKHNGFTLLEMMIVIAIVSIIAAIAIPNLLQSRTRANEATAATVLKSYANAQVTFNISTYGRSTDNSNAGEKGYCDNFRNLYFGHGIENPGVNLKLISLAFANAYARDPIAGCTSTFDTIETPSPTPEAYQGYLFGEPKEMNVSRFETIFALLGVPYTTGVTGDRAVWIGTQGTIWWSIVPLPDSYSVSILVSTPSDPTLAANTWRGL